MKALGFLASPLIAGVSALTKPKKKDMPTPLLPVTRDSVREDADRRDALRKRRGGAADIVAAAAGEPAMATGKATTGS